MERFCSFIQKETYPCVLKSKEVFKNMNLSALCPEVLRDKLQKPLKFRVGKKNVSGVQWEGSCHYVHATVEEFLHWNKITNCESGQEHSTTIQAQFQACCSSHFWCYADYMYMKDVFKNHPDILTSLDWSFLGFVNKDGHDTTMWIGSEGAHTVCHYDQYGFNIVIQVSGSKRWTLFSPQDSEFLYPSRIPYEESSVFSEVNVKNPDLQKHSRFEKSKPCTVVLRPGDILYVPHHWWHFVENLELSASVNLWYDMEVDKKCRLNESITRLLLGTCLSTEMGSKEWINPTEDIDSVCSLEQGMKYLNQSLSEVAVSAKLDVGKNNGEEKHFAEKNTEIKNFINIGEVVLTRLLPVLPSAPCEESSRKRRRTYDNALSGDAVTKTSAKMSFVDFVKCLSHEDVVKAISKVILEKQKSI